MIAKLYGVLDSILDNGAIINVGGVGYFIFASSRTLMELGAIGDPVVVHVDTHVREDHIHLFGFVIEDERAWFQLLQTVQGVGAKAALAILSALSTDEVSGSIFAQDKASLCRAEGVGPKLADRILNELKDKAPKLLGSLTQSSQPLQPSTDPMFTDAVSAMINLGYSRLDAHKTVTNVRKNGIDNETRVQIISASLKELSS
jgi:Holliday junction DNA helicase RuvA